MSDSIKISGLRKENVEIEISVKDFGYELYRQAWEKCGKPEAEGCDFVTDERGNTYIDGPVPKLVSDDPMIAKIVDVGNYLVLGKEVKLRTRRGATEDRDREEKNSHLSDK